MHNTTVCVCGAKQGQPQGVCVMRYANVAKSVAYFFAHCVIAVHLQALAVNGRAGEQENERYSREAKKT